MTPPEPPARASRGDLVEATRQMLGRCGFFVSEHTRLRPVTFDIVARRDEELLIVKVLTNVDSLGDVVANELKLLAQCLEATPLLVGERSSASTLEDGAVYVRHGIPIVTYDTLQEYLVEGVKPLVYAAPGGFYVNMDGTALRQIREARGISLGQLAEVAGVSRRAISMYEEGMGAMVEVAMKLEEYLDAPLVEPVDPLAFPRDLPEVVVDFRRSWNEPATPEATNPPSSAREAFHMLSLLGFGVLPLEKSPMNAIASDDKRLILTGIAQMDDTLSARARILANLMDVTERQGVFIVERRLTRMTLEGAPLVAREELARMDEPGDVLELIKERRKRAPER